MPKARAPRSLRAAVAERANRSCEYCRAPEHISPSSFSVEHIMPQKLNGATTLDNLAWSCQGCNNHKGAKIESLDPETGILAPFYNPRQHQWSDHFTWSEDYTHIVGLTPTGRATILAFDLNRRNLINLRLMLINNGEHPPED